MPKNSYNHQKSKCLAALHREVSRLISYTLRYAGQPDRLPVECCQIFTQQGKPLGRNLAGYRSVRAVGQRYRIIYELDHSRQEVLGGNPWYS